MQRNNAIDSVKGFAILLVMIGHCIVLNGLHESDPFLYDIIKSVQMPLFMLVSGVLAAMPVKKTGMGTGMKKLGVRAVSYLVPFFSWFVVVHLYVHAKAGTISGQMFLKELKDLLFQTDRGLWFLMTLFVATVSVMLAQTVADRMVKPGVKKAVCFTTISVLLYLLFFLQSRTGNTFLSPSLMVQYFPFYLTGYLACGYGECLMQMLLPETRVREKAAKAEPFLVAVMLVVFLLMAALLNLTAPVDGVKTLAVQMSASFLGTISCYAIVCRIVQQRKKKTEKRGFLSFVGLYTLEIYVLHFRFARLLGLSEKGLQLYSPEGLLWLILSFVLMSVLTAVCIMILRRIPVVSLLLFGKKHVPIWHKGGQSA